MKELQVVADETNQESVKKEWDRERKALQNASTLKHPHIVPVMAIFTKGPRHFLMFQWADRGNLRDFYYKTQHPLSGNAVLDIVVQLHGISEALLALHNFKRGAYRHGDLKPENILVFDSTSGDSEAGVWKIADLGLAKSHISPTEARISPTTTNKATRAYQPPEAVCHLDQARSRRFDIWSMGCITLELIVWMRYGTEGLREFNGKRWDTLNNRLESYWMCTDPDDNKFEVHPTVLDTLQVILRDPQCPKGLKEIAKLVKNKLLVIRIGHGTLYQPEHTSQALRLSSSRSSDVFNTRLEPSRCTAETFYTDLSNIIQAGRGNNDYWEIRTENNHNHSPGLLSLRSRPTQQGEPGVSAIFRLFPTFREFINPSKWFFAEELNSNVYKFSQHVCCLL